MSDLDNVLDRVVLMQRAVIANSDAVPVAFYAQENTPFWTNRISGFVITGDADQHSYTIIYSIVMRLVLANLNDDYLNEAEGKLAQYIPVVVDYFMKRVQLKRTNADTAIRWLDPLGATIVSGQTLYGQLNSVAGEQQFGVEFVLEVPLTYMIEQVVY